MSILYSIEVFLSFLALKKEHNDIVQHRNIKFPTGAAEEKMFFPVLQEIEPKNL